MSECDCLSYCGDDPRLQKGQAKPCTVKMEEEKKRRLQEAAPDLLNALILADTILAGMGPLYPQGEGARQIRAAIAKATGE